MRPVKVFTDSTSDLSREIIKQHNISIIPLYVNFDEQSFKDGVEIDPARLFRMVKETGKLPKTSAPTVSDFISAFTGYLDKGLDILHVSISSKISASYQNACSAAEQLPEGRVKVIDSLNLSCGIGILAIKAALCSEKGMELDEVSTKVQAAVPGVKAFFALDTVEYLHKGGRCSGLQFLLSSLLEIHPIIAMGSDGTMHVESKVRGNRRAVIRSLVNDTINRLNRIKPEIIVVNNCECLDDAALIRAQLVESVKNQQILLANVGCVIASHCGPRTLGIFYLEK